jgi:hypothetical protein
VSGLVAITFSSDLPLTVLVLEKGVKNGEKTP